MPVGIPKVVFLSPEEEDPNWVDVYNRLYQERTLFLGQEVETDVSNQLMGLMIYLSLEDNSKEQFLFINSPGGSVIPGIGIFDTMQIVPLDVHTICMGLAASMGSFVLVGGEITKRIALPHARIMIHQPASAFCQAKTGEFVLEAEELLSIRDKITGVYVQRTTKPLWVIAEDMERDVFMSATEAQTYGIIDLIGIE